MTVSYSREVATSKLGTFARLLFRWKGSIYRLLYREMLFFLLLYYLICVIYHYALNEDLKRKFEKFSVFCQKYTEVVPLTFVLGFFVSVIIGRWWNIFSSIYWPDRICLHIQTFVIGDDERGRTLRRSAARYINLAQVLVLRDISTAVKKRFPTLDHLVEGGFLTEEEHKQYEKIDMNHHKFWLPLQWTCSLLAKARKESKIEADATLVRMIEEILNIRNSLASLLCYDWISVPLVYTQVVTIAVYSYFLACLFGRQYLTNEPDDHDDRHERNHEMDMYFPIFTVLQFFFYMGWLKVAESIMNPLGEDDDDFEVNYLIERNLQVSYSIVDENCMKIPQLQRDIHWNEPEASVPHTQASAGLKSNPPVLSASNVDVKPEDAEIKSALSNVSLTNSDFPRKKSSVRPNDILRKNSTRGSTNSVKQSLRRLVSNVSNRLSRHDLRSSILVEEESVPLGAADPYFYYEPNRFLPAPELHSPTVPSRSVSVCSSPSERKVSTGSKKKLSPVSEVVNEINGNNLVDLTPEENAAVQESILNDITLVDKDVETSMPLLEKVNLKQKQYTQRKRPKSADVIL